jgi:hypothetical protein
VDFGFYAVRIVKTVIGSKYFKIGCVSAAFSSNTRVAKSAEVPRTRRRVRWITGAGEL